MGGGAHIYCIFEKEKNRFPHELMLQHPAGLEEAFIICLASGEVHRMSLFRGALALPAHVLRLRNRRAADVSPDNLISVNPE